MSDTPRGPGWWQANDGKWYSPQQRPGTSWNQQQAAPQFPPVAAAPKSSGCGPMAIGAVLAALLLIGGCTALIVAVSDDEPELVRPAPTTTSADSQPDESEGFTDDNSEAYAVGDLVELGTWTVQVHGVAPVDPSDDFFTPDPGMKWVGVDVEVTNLSKRSASVWSLICFTIQDDTNRSWDQAIFADTPSKPPDGQIPAGGFRRGTIVYEVPEGATGLQLHFDCDPFGSGVAVIDLG